MVGTVMPGKFSISKSTWEQVGMSGSGVTTIASGGVQPPTFDILNWIETLMPVVYTPTVGGATIPVHRHVVLLGHSQPLLVQIADVVLCLGIPGGGQVIPGSHCRCVVLSLHGRQASAKLILSSVGYADVRPSEGDTTGEKAASCAHVP